MFGYNPDEYIAMGKPGPDEIEETTLKQVNRSCHRCDGPKASM